ncbi:MAG: LLM class flavin-dependent oxidoreductase, partial [Microterricola sp.]
GAIVQPMPPQQGGIPIWVAGGGEKVTLKIAARYADYTNFTGTLAEFDHKSAVLRGHCETIGRDFDSITRSSNFNTIIAETEAEVAERIDAVEARMARHVGVDVAAKYIHENYRSGSVAVGTPEQVIERLQERKRHGLGYANHYFPEAAYDRATQQLFEQTVIPALAD